VIEGRISTTTVQMPTTRKTDRQPAAFRSRPGFAAYTTSKAAVAMLTRQAALGYADDGIRVNAVTPGLIDTPLLGDLTPRFGRRRRHVPHRAGSALRRRGGWSPVDEHEE
jgi:NAD(P)-dependent dehydrogenase (short-subunit alcohol dehydrogenase family)